MQLPYYFSPDIYVGGENTNTTPNSAAFVIDIPVTRNVVGSDVSS